MWQPKKDIVQKQGKSLGIKVYTTSCFWSAVCHIPFMFNILSAPFLPLDSLSTSHPKRMLSLRKQIDMLDTEKNI